MPSVQMGTVHLGHSGTAGDNTKFNSCVILSLALSLSIILVMMSVSTCSSRAYMCHVTLCLYFYFLCLLSPPKGGRGYLTGISDAPPPTAWNLRAVVWFHFTISSLVLLPSPATLSVLSFFWLLAHSPFSRKFFIIFRHQIDSFCMAPV